MDDTSSTQAKPLTFSDAMMLIWSAYSLAWKASVASLAGWWSGGATASIQVIAPPNASAVTAKESQLTLVFTRMTVTINVTVT